MKIAIPDDCQDVARDLAGWGSPNAKAEVFTAPFARTDQVVERKIKVFNSEAII
jgi:hypothetical protein